MAHSHTAQPETFDELDPHGFNKGHGHHGHVIVGPFVLRTVLALLLFFTVLTVGQAQLEVFIAKSLNVTFPLWVNIVACMAIAVVKAVLVMAYFMQLRYDNPMNTIVMAFTILGVALFIGFTSLDLLTRDRVYAWKDGQITAGGTGVGARNLSAGSNIVQSAKNRYLEKLTAELGTLEAAQAQYDKEYAKKHKAHGHKSDHRHDVGNDGNRSRPVTGPTGVLGDAAPKAENAPGH